MVSKYYSKARDIERPYMASEVVRQRMRTLEVLALNAGEAAVDVGCGIGLLTYEMALEVGSDGQVIGIDSSSDMLTHAAERCADFDQVEIKEGDVRDLPLGDQTCDAAACVQVLLYAEDVPGAIAEMRRVLRPGGRIAVLETDWRSVILSSSDQATTRRVFEAWDDAVASPNLPVRLAPILREQGFTAVRVEAIPILDTSRSSGSFSVNSLDGIARIAQERGAISKDQEAAWLEDLQRQGPEGTYFFCVNRFLFSATKL